MESKRNKSNPYNNHKKKIGIIEAKHDENKIRGFLLPYANKLNIKIEELKKKYENRSSIEQIDKIEEKLKDNVETPEMKILIEKINQLAKDRKFKIENNFRPIVKFYLYHYKNKISKYESKNEEQQKINKTNLKELDELIKNLTSSDGILYRIENLYKNRRIRLNPNEHDSNYLSFIEVEVQNYFLRYFDGQTVIPKLESITSWIKEFPEIEYQLALTKFRRLILVKSAKYGLYEIIKNIISIEESLGLDHNKSTGTYTRDSYNPYHQIVFCHHLCRIPSMIKILNESGYADIFAVNRNKRHDIRSIVVYETPSASIYSKYNKYNRIEKEFIYDKLLRKINSKILDENIKNSLNKLEKDTYKDVLRYCLIDNLDRTLDTMIEYYEMMRGTRSTINKNLIIEKSILTFEKIISSSRSDPNDRFYLHKYFDRYEHEMEDRDSIINLFVGKIYKRLDNYDKRDREYVKINLLTILGVLYRLGYQKDRIKETLKESFKDDNYKDISILIVHSNIKDRDIITFVAEKSINKSIDKNYRFAMRDVMDILMEKRMSEKDIISLIT